MHALALPATGSQVYPPECTDIPIRYAREGKAGRFPNILVPALALCSGKIGQVVRLKLCWARRVPGGAGAVRSYCCEASHFDLSCVAPRYHTSRRCFCARERREGKALGRPACSRTLFVCGRDDGHFPIQRGPYFVKKERTTQLSRLLLSQAPRTHIVVYSTGVTNNICKHKFYLLLRYAFAIAPNGIDQLEYDQRRIPTQQ